MTRKPPTVQPVFRVNVLRYSAAMEIPEEQAAAALRRVAEIGARRADLLRQADALLPDLEAAALDAARAGALRNRIRELAQVSPRMLYAWLDAAGLEIRTKRPSTRTPGSRGRRALGTRQEGDHGTDQ
jgi:hypothetical protein